MTRPPSDLTLILHHSQIVEDRTEIFCVSAAGIFSLKCQLSPTSNAEMLAVTCFHAESFRCPAKSASRLKLWLSEASKINIGHLSLDRFSPE
jgi:hypothetical protein